VTRPSRLVMALLALTTVACGAVGLGGATNQRDNAVRRAALAYELQTRGPADEVLVDFGFLEWRDNLGFPDGRTVWLNPVAQSEFFAERDPRRSYIYLRAPVARGEDVLIQVERGGPDPGQARLLTLRLSGAAWQIVGDEAPQ
jgi:hypothetical protein